MEKLPISLCIITHNSAGRLRGLITSLREIVNEVLVADQHSTDGTYEDAKALADFVFQRRHKGTADPDRNWLFNLANNNWVLYLDDDELLEEDTKAALADIIKLEVDAIWFKRNNYIDGIDARQICGEDPQCRLFRVGSVNFPDRIHKYPEPANGVRVAYLDYGIRHDRTYEGLVKANKDREIIANAEEKKIQDDFIKKVDSFLKHGLRPSK
jgi:glycosyltransferase involved in cell wall biosynthesis